MNPVNNNFFSRLPDDVVEGSISKFLDIESLISLSKTNKKIRNLVFQITDSIATGYGWKPQEEITFKKSKETPDSLQYIQQLIRQVIDKETFFKEPHLLKINSRKKAAFFLNNFKVDSPNKSQLTLLNACGNLKIMGCSYSKSTQGLLEKFFSTKAIECIQLGANVNVVVKSECIPLHYSLDFSSDTPLHIAASMDCLDLAKLLLEKGAELNAVNEHGVTPLHIATWFGYQELATLLLEKGANVNAVDEHGDTPLRNAAEKGHLEMVKFLLEKGANVNAVNRDRNTPLHFATRFGYQELAKLLLEKGAELNAVNRYRDTPLDIATRFGYQELATLLLEKGANVNAVNRDRVTPLHIATCFGHQELAKLFLEKGANVNAVNEPGDTPLHFATRFGYQELAKLLLEKGANVNAVNEHGDTPLHIATRFGYQEVVKEINARNKSRLNPFKWSLLPQIRDSLYQLFKSFFIFFAEWFSKAARFFGFAKPASQVVLE